MRSLGEMAMLQTPDYYEVRRVLEVPVTVLRIGAGSLGNVLYLVEFRDGELAVPGAEPIGVFGDGKGDRQYFWRDAFWGEVDLCHLRSAPHQLQQHIWVNHTDPPATGSVSRLLYRLDKGEGGWNGGGY